MSFASMVMIVMNVSIAGSAEAEQAEMQRILEDMKQFREQGNWVAVEKKYQRILEFSKGTPTFEMHVLGAEAASNQGNVSQVKVRLTKALALEEVEKTRQWLESLDQTFAPVTIKVPKKFETIPELQIAMMPFFPEQQLALGYAKEQIQANGKYQGYLPFGEYTIAGSTFTVAQGDTGTVVVVKPEGASTAVATGPSENTKSSTASDGMPLRLDLGFSAANAGESGVVGEALAFGGVGTRLGVGTSFGLTGNMALVAEVGYHGMFGAGEEPSIQGVANIGYQATPTVYHGAFTWLAGSMAFSNIEVLVGPIIEFASVQTQGMTLNPSAVEYSVGQADYMPIQGTLLASGFSGGVTYAAFDLGYGLQGGLSSYVGAQSDGSRVYSWGQVSLTIKGL